MKCIQNLDNYVCYCMFMQIGSPTALSDSDVFRSISSAASKHHGVYIATGALWGGQDIQKMADRGTLKVTIA